MFKLYGQEYFETIKQVAPVIKITGNPGIDYPKRPVVLDPEMALRFCGYRADKSVTVRVAIFSDKPHPRQLGEAKALSLGNGCYAVLETVNGDTVIVQGLEVKSEYPKVALIPSGKEMNFLP